MIRDPLCNGRPCLIVGSAPGVKDDLPGVPDDWVVIGANGGAVIAQECGLIVDALCTTSYLFRRGNSRQEERTIQSLIGLHVGTVYIDTKHGTAGDVANSLDLLGATYRSLVSVNRDDRAEVVLAATGSDERVSTGVWAACLAAVSGASEVHLAGISMEPGHEGMPWDTMRRDHVLEDSRTLSRLGVSL